MSSARAAATTFAAGGARLALRAIRKAYPGVVANDGIDLVVMPGEIHAVLGENGAGKSTLMKVICGVTPPTRGEMLWEGKRLLPRDPAHARALGIGMVFQHFSLFETLTVAENIALTHPGAIDRAAFAGEISAVSARYGLTVDPRQLVHALSVGERQRVEIVRCLMQRPKLVILDEPTSVLTPQAVRKLFDTLRTLAAEGCSILYVSHKLDEIRELCHVATVLRGGRVTATCVPSDETPQSMARMMIGAELPVPRHGAQAAGAEARLRVAGLSRESPDPYGVDLKDIHLDVHSGEIVGIAGISGNGQRELLWAISGEEPLAEKYPVQILGIEAGRMRAGRRRWLGLGFVPEERLGRGALARMTLAENALLTANRRGMVRWGLIDSAAVAAFARECIERFKVIAIGPQARADSLSGGNLQKFIVGREVLQQPKVLVVAQPTWGVDVGAAAFIRQALLDLSAAGAAVLVISEELDELFEICDRIAVIANGKLSPAKRTSETSVEEIGLWMSGRWPGAEQPPEISDAA
jgi:simple sugar transport system ATP-binding protein